MAVRKGKSAKFMNDSSLPNSLQNFFSIDDGSEIITLFYPFPYAAVRALSLFSEQGENRYSSFSFSSFSSSSSSLSLSLHFLLSLIICKDAFRESRVF